MKLRHQSTVGVHAAGDGPHTPGGVTLVEVLMALMIMSIGVSAVAVLFPISALRSIQASQLTNGAIVKYGVETLVEVNPGLIFDPDGDFNGSAPLAHRRAALAEHFRTPAARNYIVDPLGFYTHLADGSPALATVFGNDGTNPLGVPRFGGGLKLTNGQYVPAAPPAPVFPMPGLTGAEIQALRFRAQALASQGDGWETQIDAPPSTATYIIHPNGSVVGIPLSRDLDLSQVPTSQLVLPQDGAGGYLVEDPELYRIVLFSTNGKFSQAFPLTYIDTSTNVAYFTEDVNLNGNLDALEDFSMDGNLDIRGLPPEFRVDQNGNGTLDPGEEIVERVLLQSMKVADYSWMLNVRRRGDGQARSVDVIVRFSDGISTSDERVFEALFVPSTATTQSHSVWVRLPSRSNPADPTEPSIRKGKFIFDAANGVWYRIQDVQERPLFGTGNPLWTTFDYLIIVEQPIRASDGAGRLTGPGAPIFAPAMFPTGIVDVYPMGSRNLPESMQVPTF